MNFLTAGSALAVGGLLPSRHSRADAPASASRRPQPPVDPNHKALVGIARGSSIEDAVKSAVALAGGLDFIKPGQTVLIKPNVTGAAKFPTTTNPEVLYAVIKLVADRGPKQIYVSDRSFSPAFSDSRSQDDRRDEVRGAHRGDRSGEKGRQSAGDGLGTGIGRRGAGAVGPAEGNAALAARSSRPTPAIGPTASSRPSCCSPSIT